MGGQGREGKAPSPRICEISLSCHSSHRPLIFSSRLGGKVKPLKAPKKEKKDLDEDEIAYKAKQAADAKARKEMADKAKGKGPMNGGQQGKNFLGPIVPYSGCTSTD